MSTGFLPTPAWRSARALLNKPLGDIVDDFVAGLYNSAAMKCDSQLAVDPDTDRNAILVRSLALVPQRPLSYPLKFQLLKGISLGCLGFVLDAAHAAADILVDLNATSSVRTWLYCGPQVSF